jgi:hypothetical protein
VFILPPDTATGRTAPVFIARVNCVLLSHGIRFRDELEIHHVALLFDLATRPAALDYPRRPNLLLQHLADSRI